MLRGVIFDFDGVLVDSERAHFEALQSALAELAGLSIDFAEYAERYLAFDDRTGIRLALEQSGREANPDAVERVVTRKRQVFEALLPRIGLLAGAAGLVRALREAGVPLAVASGARRMEIVNLLEAQGLAEAFVGVISADDVDNFKPHPEPYLRGRALVGARDDPRGVVAIEDSPTGMASARAANLRVVGVTNSYPRERLGLAHQVVDSLEELTLDSLQALVAPPGG